MSTFDYVNIPADVIRLQSTPTDNPVRPFTKISTSLPSPPPSPDAPTTSSTIFNPTKSLSTFLLSTSLPASIPTSTSPRKSSTALLSTRDPLSIPITTVNFRRFVARVGPVFWLQDRVEEVLMWKRGWKVTAVWIAVYAFLCYFPRLVLLLPHAILAAIMLSTYPTPSPSESTSSKNPPAPIAPPPSEGSVDWQANLQAIQNLMGGLCDAYDLVSPLTPHITHRSTHTSLILTLTLLSFLILLPALPLIPLRPLLFLLGTFPFLWTHPFTQDRIIPLLKSIPATRSTGTIKGTNPNTALTGLMYTNSKYASLKMKLRRWIDDDRLEDRHWGAEMREVELWENERWAPGPSSSVQIAGTWSKSHLRPADRAPWTRGRDGWSGLGAEVRCVFSLSLAALARWVFGYCFSSLVTLHCFALAGRTCSNLTFSLAPGWTFVETEGWRPDAVGSWVSAPSVSGNGWVYTNDVWADPHRAPVEAWKAVGMTRRRRWVRRVYFNPALVESA
ncbi:hypothetical protein K503DRAFT_684952 [Rhizopogon vinicolor AM-OR11-026]|uniref:TECPR1-like DysF domain-containing protein n=1 Tax=Rhizopogon vinicolor AM-OR11-026 TaxID=1314800 RepID=A0A1B7NA25_9AGAM|nr:hypothetical protein K503DRAFT_684952 [Rhizopogon vinicolor AM-OR11-026]